MKRSKSEHKKQRQVEFGNYLKNCIKSRWGSQREALGDLNISEAKLSYIVTGERQAPDELLIKIAEKCDIPVEEIIRQKHWPQLPLFLLTAIMNPSELPKAIEEYLEELENKLEAEDKKELTRYAALLLLRRHVIKKN